MARSTSHVFGRSACTLALSLLLLSGILQGVSAAGIVQEVEPNDDFASANALDLDETGQGDCTYETDFVFANLTAGTTYTFNFTSGTTMRPADFTLHIYQPNGTEYQTQVKDAEGNLSVVAVATGRHAVGVECRSPAGPWTVSFSEIGPSGPIQGADEVEHNDRAAVATPVPASNAAHGSVLPPDDPVDFWVVNLAAGQAIRVSLDGMSTSRANIAEYDAGTGQLSGSGDTILVQAAAPGPLAFAVLPQGDGGDYMFTVEYVADASVFSEGPDETEPNNQRQDANNVEDGVPFRGQLDPEIDTSDYLTVTVSRASTVYANLTPVGSCGYACPTLKVYRSDGGEALDPDGDPLEGDALVFGARAATLWYVEVQVGGDAREYTLQVDVDDLPFEEGATLSLFEANDTGLFEFFIAGTDTRCPMGYNFRMCGDGKLFGESLLIYYDSYAPVPFNVTIPAGLRLDADDEGVPNFVTTRDTVVHVAAYASDDAPVVAAMEGPGEFAPSWLTFFDPVGMASGDEAKVIQQTRTGNYSVAAEMAALWAGVSGQTRADLAEWSASTGTIDEAGRLLAAAGVPSDITPTGQEPPANGGTSNNNGGGGTSGTGVGDLVLPVLVVAFVLVLLGAVIAGRSKRRRQAQAPPLAGAPSSYGAAGAMAPPAYGAAPPAASPPPPPMYASPATYAPVQPAAAAACPSCNQPIQVAVTACPWCGAGIAWD